MKVLKSLDIVVVVPYSLRRVHQLRGVYPTQRVLVVDTDHCHFLYSAKTDQRDLIVRIPRAQRRAALRGRPQDLR